LIGEKKTTIWNMYVGDNFEDSILLYICHTSSKWQFCSFKVQTSN